MRRRLQSTWPAIALLVLAALVSVVGSDFLPHTDDGCQAEVHCLACRTAFSRATPVVVASPVVIALASLGSVLPERPASLAQAEPARLSSRGPPSA